MTRENEPDPALNVPRELKPLLWVALLAMIGVAVAIMVSYLPGSAPAANAHVGDTIEGDMTVLHAEGEATPCPECSAADGPPQGQDK